MVPKGGDVWLVLVTFNFPISLGHTDRGVAHREEWKLLNALILGPLIGQRVTLTSSLAAAILTTQTIRFDPIVN